MEPLLVAFSILKLTNPHFTLEPVFFPFSFPAWFLVITMFLPC